MNHCLRVKQIFVCSNENKQIKIRSFPSQKYRNPHAIIGEKGSYDTSDFLLRLRIDLRPHKADLDIHWRPFPLSENLPAGIPEIKIAAANVRGLHNRKLTEFHVPAIFQ